MAKTDWTNGSFITPAFMIAFSGNNSITGHSHDGLDNDGSVPPITLSGGADVVGTLPLGNMSDIPNSKLTEYEEGTVDVKITTAHLSIEQTGTFKYVKMGKQVTLKTELIQGTSISGTMGISPQTTWPAGLVTLSADGASDTFVAGYAVNQGQNVAARVRPPDSTDGSIGLLINDGTRFDSFSAFDNNGVKGISSQNITYMSE